MSKEFHEVANIFPLMQGAEFETLKADIASNGLLEAIWLHSDGRIIDGRNRYRACLAAGIEPVYRTWNGSGSLVSFVVSLNLHRRHLTATQLAVVGVDILPILEAEAQERKVTAGKLYGEKHQREVGKKIYQPLDRAPKSAEVAAQTVGTNQQYVSDAKRISEDAPEVLEMMRAGVVNMPAAKQLAKMDSETRGLILNTLKESGASEVGGREIKMAERSVKQQRIADAPPMPSNKYRIWYADPPWEYNDSGVITDTDSYGRAARHYLTMSIGNLCAMKEEIADRCETDAVLFLWTTSPLLEVAFDVVRAWGFKYKTSFIWDKIKHNFGHYNSVRHELLLICTRGSCTPDNLKLFDSVQSIERTEKHSEKPQEFRDIIDTIYTHGNKIELFARETHEGWDTWGNEA